MSSVGLVFAASILAAVSGQNASNLPRPKLLSATRATAVAPAFAAIPYSGSPVEAAAPVFGATTYPGLSVDGAVLSVDPSAYLASLVDVKVPEFQARSSDASLVFLEAPSIDRAEWGVGGSIAIEDFAEYARLELFSRVQSVDAPVWASVESLPSVVSVVPLAMNGLSAEPSVIRADPFMSPIELWKAGPLRSIRRQAELAKRNGNVAEYDRLLSLYVQGLDAAIRRRELFGDRGGVRGGRRQR